MLLKTAAALLSGAFILPVVNMVHGTNEDDSLSGTDGRDRLFGHAGHDDITGGLGDDRYFGGAGHDWMYDLDGGDDVMFGGEGSDAMRPGPGDDRMFGGAGNDQIDFWRQVDVFSLEPCEINASDFDVGFGGSGDDLLQWASGPAILSPFLPPWCVHGGDGEFDGGSGWDTVVVGVGSFYAESSGYELVEGPTANSYVLTSMLTGAQVVLRNCEEVVFYDVTIPL